MAQSKARRTVSFGNKSVVSFQTYSTVGDFVGEIMREPVNKHWVDKSCDSQTEGETKWYGTPSFEKAVDLFTKGWTDPIDKIKAAVNGRVRKAVTGDTHRAKNEYTVAGHTPSVARAIIGLPNAMYTTKRRPVKDKTVHIIYDIGGNCNVTKETLQKSAITVAAMVQIIELSGYRVRLDIASVVTISNNNEFIGPLITIKDFKQPLNIAKICFPLVHTSMFRRFVFRWIETSDLTPKHNAGYGWPLANNTKDVQALRDELSKERTYFCGISDSSKADYDTATLIDNLGITILGVNA